MDLWWYASNGGVDGAQEAISRGADVNYKSQQGWTGLHIATINQNEDYAQIIRLLLQNQADPEIEDDMGRKPLLFACMYGLIESVKDLLPFVKHKDVADRQGRNDLVHAAISNHVEVVQ